MPLTITDDQLTRCERAFWDAADRSISTDAERVARSDGAFWAALVAMFPQVTTGDLDPLITHRLTHAEARALDEWRGDGLQPETNAALRGAMREAADLRLAFNHPANQEPNEDRVSARSGSCGPGDRVMDDQEHVEAVRAAVRDAINALLNEQPHDEPAAAWESSTAFVVVEHWTDRIAAAVLGSVDPSARPSACVGDGLACTNPEHDHSYHPDAASEPQAHLGDELACNHCGRPLFYCRRTVDYWHADPTAPACFLVAARS